MGYEKITLETLEQHLGHGKKVGDEIHWQCPHCMDKHKDNLKFSISKGILWCFASNGEHSKQILRDIYRKNNQVKTNYYSETFNNINKNNDIKDEKINVYTPEKQEEMLLYMDKCNQNLLNDIDLLHKLELVRGINKNTINDCGIGLDLKRNSFVIPSFKYSIIDNYIIGFEYRPIDFSKKILRSVGTPLEMCMINCYTPQTEILAIVEGYMDGFALYQYLKEQNQAQYYHIVTPCNGVNGLTKQLNEIKFNKYKTCYLYIDNDKAGNQAASVILENYPFLKRFIMSCGCKDFNEHYIKCIKNA